MEEVGEITDVEELEKGEEKVKEKAEIQDDKEEEMVTTYRN